MHMNAAVGATNSIDLAANTSEPDRISAEEVQAISITKVYATASSQTDVGVTLWSCRILCNCNKDTQRSIIIITNIVLSF